MKYELNRKTGELKFVLEGPEDLLEGMRMVMDKATGKGMNRPRARKVMAALVDCINLWELHRSGGAEEGEITISVQGELDI